MTETWIPVIINTLSLGSCIIVFNIYPQTRQKSIGFKMILVLCISDFLLSILNLVRSFCTLDTMNYSFTTMVHFFLAHFSLMWSTMIALITYFSLSGKGRVSKGRLFMNSLFIVLTLTSLIIFNAPRFSIKILSHDKDPNPIASSSALSPLIDINGNNKNTLNFLLFELVGKITPMSLTIMSYFLAYRKLREHANSFSLGIEYSRLIWYPLCQILLYGPLLLNDFERVLLGVKSDSFDWAVLNLFQFAGFVNSMVYMFKRTKLRPTNYPPKESFESPSLSSSYSFSSTKSSQQEALLL